MDAGDTSRARKLHWWGTSSINLGARQPMSHAIMFYCMSVVAMLIFAPCVLVPIWRDVKKVQGGELEAAAALAQLQRQIDRNNVRIKALEADPLVIARVARRELNQQPADEQQIQFTAAELAGLRLNIPEDLEQPVEVPPVPTPAWVAAINHWLPAWAWSDLFAKSPNREMLLVMAGALLLSAFVLYTPKAEARVRESSESSGS